ncbi:MAG: isoprenylcysteine carboxylmethyltransferase family protein [Opitutaceae bacterium]|nr:isoprenylcysteine carboxylmethyltransferase family protein [Opitutaceae bacterium]
MKKNQVKDAAMILAAIVVGCGSIGLLAFGPGGAVDLHLSRAGALALDAILSLAFFVQHSVMVRRPVKAAMARRIPERYLGAIYAITSGVVLGTVVLLWQRTETWAVATGPLRWAGIALSLLATAGFVWGFASLRHHDPLGIRAIRAHRAGLPEPAAALQVRGPYRWVRHPLYLCVLVLFWANPEVSADRLLFNLLWSAWVVLATFLEERDLTAELGVQYLAYRQRVPMLLPWKGPAPADLGKE